MKKANSGFSLVGLAATLFVIAALSAALYIALGTGAIKVGSFSLEAQNLLGRTPGSTVVVPPPAGSASAPAPVSSGPLATGTFEQKVEWLKSATAEQRRIAWEQLSEQDKVALHSAVQARNAASQSAPAPSASTAPTPAPSANVPAAGSSDPRCKVAGTVYVEQVKGCVAHVTDPQRLAKEAPDSADDPNCKGKPVGHKYDVAVTHPDGKTPGVAHKVCGKRPA